MNLPGVVGSVTVEGFTGAIELTSLSAGAAGPGTASPGWAPLRVSTADAAVSVPLLKDLLGGLDLGSVVLSEVDLSSGAPVVIWQLLLSGQVEVVAETIDDVEPGGVLVPPGSSSALPVGFDVFFDVFFDSATLTVGGPGANIPEAPYAAVLPAAVAAAAGAYAVHARSRRRREGAAIAAGEQGVAAPSVTSGPTPAGVDES
jgi:hypothetical protein